MADQQPGTGEQAQGSTGSAEGTGTGTAPAGNAITPVGVSSFDPQGDGSVTESLASSVLDGDTTSGWRSGCFAELSWEQSTRIALGSPALASRASVWAMWAGE